MVTKCSECLTVYLDVNTAVHQEETFCVPLAWLSDRNAKKSSRVYQAPTRGRGNPAPKHMMMSLPGGDALAFGKTLWLFFTIEFPLKGGALWVECSLEG